MHEIPKDVQTAVEAALDFVKTTRPDQAARYAQAYLEAIPFAANTYGSEGVKNQISYALCNLLSWTGPEARAAKKILNTYVREGRSS